MEDPRSQQFSPIYRLLAYIAFLAFLAVLLVTNNTDLSDGSELNVFVGSAVVLALAFFRPELAVQVYRIWK